VQDPAQFLFQFRRVNGAGPRGDLNVRPRLGDLVVPGPPSAAGTISASRRAITFPRNGGSDIAMLR
jgi:hypothetical protein